ncbi:hypothetical protein Q5752_002402 [Cryptotrichosporon argae]
MSRSVMLALGLGLVRAVAGRPQAPSPAASSLDAPSALVSSPDGPSSTTSAWAAASSTAPAQAAGYSSHNFGLVMEVVIPLAAVVVVLLIVLVVLARRNGWSWRSKLTARARASGVGRPLFGTAARPITAEQLAGAPAADTGTRAGRVGRTVAASGTRRSRQESRRLRRTESGGSVRTLPAYSTQAGEEEVVLVRQRTDSDLAEEGDSVEMEMRHVGESVTLLATVPAQEIQAPGETGETLVADTAVAHSQELPTSRPSTDSAQQSMSQHEGYDAIASRGWGEAPPYAEAVSTPSLPLPITAPTRPSALSFRDVESGLPPSQSGFARTTSQIRSFFRTPFAHPPATRTHHPTHSSSHLLTPTMSRLSTPRTARSRSASMSVSLGSPDASTASLLISSPIPHTAVRASFDARDLPRAGLNTEQMRFLGSSEAVHLVGQQIGQPPPGARGRRRSSAAVLGPFVGSPRPSLDAPPPSWAEVDGARRAEQAAVGSRLGRPADRDTAAEAQGDTAYESTGDNAAPTGSTQHDAPAIALTASTPSGPTPAPSPPPSGPEP